MVLLASEYEILKKGEKAPNFSLPATDGKTYSLSDFDSKALLVIFMCNHCPFVIPKIDEIRRIATDYKEKGLVVIGINPNESDNYPEDSFEKMKEYFEEWEIDFVYLHDESQEVAKAYGAVCTPDPFLFNSMRELIFHSRIDDTHGDKPAIKHELYEAISELLAEGRISVKEQPSMGCSIKWKN